MCLTLQSSISILILGYTESRKDTTKTSLLLLLILTLLWFLRLFPAVLFPIRQPQKLTGGGLLFCTFLYLVNAFYIFPCNFKIIELSMCGTGILQMLFDDQVEYN